GIMAAAFAPLSRLAVGVRSEFHAFVRRLMIGLGAVLSLTAVATYLLAPFLLRTLYGDGFRDSVPVLQILVWSWVLFSMSRVLGDALVAIGKQVVVAKVVLATTVLGMAYYLILVPASGAQGAAWAFVLSNATAFVLAAPMA